MGRRGPTPQEAPFETVAWGPVHWRGLPALFPSQQVGVYGTARLNQYPGRWEGAQLFNGVRGLRSAWSVPSRSLRPIWMQTMKPGNSPGAQRFGSAYSGASGPLSVAQMRAALFHQQLSASALPDATAFALIRQANNMPGAA